MRELNDDQTSRYRYRSTAKLDRDGSPVTIFGKWPRARRRCLGVKDRREWSPGETQVVFTCLSRWLCELRRVAKRTIWSAEASAEGRTKGRYARGERGSEPRKRRDAPLRSRDLRLTLPPFSDKSIHFLIKIWRGAVAIRRRPEGEAAAIAGRRRRPYRLNSSARLGPNGEQVAKAQSHAALR